MEGQAIVAEKLIIDRAIDISISVPEKDSPKDSKWKYEPEFVS